MKDKSRAQLVRELESLRQQVADCQAQCQQAQEAWRASEQKLRMTLDSLRGAVFFFDADMGRIVDCNPAASAILGYTRDEILSQAPALLHVGEAAWEGFRESLRSAEDNRWPDSFQSEMKRKDGAIFPVEHSFTPLRDAQGNCSGWVGVMRDVTEREQTERALRDSEQRYRTISELVSDHVFSLRVEPDGTMVREWAMGSFDRITGFTTEERDARADLFSVVHPDDMSNLQQHFRSLLSGDRPDSMEFRIVTKDGEERWLCGYGRPKRDEALGRVVGIIGAVQDVTERKRMEEMLHESEAKYRSLVERANDGVAIFQDGVFKYANPRLAEMAGYTPDELIGTSFLQYVFPEDIPFMADLYQRRMAGAEAPPVYELAVKCKDGHKVQVEVNAAVITYQGSPADHGIVRDITERKRAEQALRESEQQYRQLIETLQEGIWVIDKEACTTFVNARMAEMLGYSVDEMQGKHLFSFTDERGVEMGKRYLERRQQGIKEQHDSEFLRKDGSRIYVTLETAPITDEHGNYAGAIAGVINITQRMRAEQALQASEERYRTLFENAVEGIIVVREGCIVLANPACATMLGYHDPQALIGLTVDHLMPEEVRARMSVWLRQWRGEPVSTGPFQSHIIRQDGTEIDILIYHVSIKYDGCPALLTFLHDITEQLHNEQRIAAIHQIGQAATASLELDQVLARIVEGLKSVFPVDHASLSLWDENERLFLTVLETHEVPARSDQGARPLEHNAAPGGDVGGERRFARHDSSQTESPGSRLSVQLATHGRLVGSLELSSRQPDGYSSRDRELLEQLAPQISIAIENARLYQAEREQRELAETLGRIGVVLASTLDVDKVLDHLLEQVSRVVPNDAGGIMLVEGDMARVARWRGHARTNPEGWGNAVFSIAETWYVRHMFTTRESVVIPDTYADSNWIRTPPIEWLRSCVGVPICARDEVIGFLNVASATPGFFGQLHAHRLRAFAHQAAIALQNARLFDQAQRTTNRLETLSRRFVSLQEAERRHVARELHDEVGQLLTGLKMVLDMAARLPDGQVRGSLGRAEALVDELFARVRDMSLSLRPAMLDDLGLVPTLVWHLDRYTAQTNVPVTFKHAGVEGRFAPAIETAVYRIVQEALTNVARHAGACHASVRLWTTSDTLAVQIEDDGAGFDPEAVLENNPSGGLAGMRERAALLGGQVTIESAQGSGTILAVQLPLRGSMDAEET